MATGQQFIDALKAAIAPATVSPGRATADEAVFDISDGRVVRVKRREVRDASDSDVTSIVQKLLSV